MARLDLFLARDQRHGVGSDLLDDAVVDLPGEQAQRQADHTRPVSQHALDRVVRLAGVGRPQDEGHPPRAITRSPVRCGKRQVHQVAKRLRGCRASTSYERSPTASSSGKASVPYRFKALCRSSHVERVRNEARPNRTKMRNQDLFSPDFDDVPLVATVRGISGRSLACKGLSLCLMRADSEPNQTQGQCRTPNGAGAREPYSPP